MKKINKKSLSILFLSLFILSISNYAISITANPANANTSPDMIYAIRKYSITGIGETESSVRNAINTNPKNFIDTKLSNIQPESVSSKPDNIDLIAVRIYTQSSVTTLSISASPFSATLGDQIFVFHSEGCNTYCPAKQVIILANYTDQEYFINSVSQGSITINSGGETIEMTLPTDTLHEDWVWDSQSVAIIYTISGDDLICSFVYPSNGAIGIDIIWPLFGIISIVASILIFRTRKRVNNL